MHGDLSPANPVRYFILNLGRCGSSLLGAALADAGADFGFEPPRDWDPRSGQMESRAIKRAAHHYRRAYDIGEGRKYLVSPVLESKYRLKLGRWYLRQALQTSQYLKISDLDLVVQPSFKLGFSPRIILNYRQLEPMLSSLLVGRTHAGPDQLARDYVRIYRQGLLLLQSFGGCVVSYNELQDAQSSAWAAALGTVTALDPAALMKSRERRLNGYADPDDIAPVYDEAYSIYSMLECYRGRALEPSRQVIRATTPRCSEPS